MTGCVFVNFRWRNRLTRSTKRVMFVWIRGWGTFLLHSVVDTGSQPEQDEYLLTVRYLDGDAERTQTFKLVFDKTRFGFLPNTMHL